MATANDPAPGEENHRARPPGARGHQQGSLPDLDRPPVNDLPDLTLGLLPTCTPDDTRRAGLWAIGAFIVGIVLGPAVIPSGLLGAWAITLLLGGATYVTWRCADQWRPLIPAVLIPVALLVLLTS